MERSPQKSQSCAQPAIVFAKVQDQANSFHPVDSYEQQPVCFLQIASYISRHTQCIYLEGDIILATEHVFRLVFGRDSE